MRVALGAIALLTAIAAIVAIVSGIIWILLVPFAMLLIGIIIVGMGRRHDSSPIGR